MKSSAAIALSFLMALLPPVKAAEYIYEKNIKQSAVGVVELHPVNNETVNYAPLCAQFLASVKITKVHEEGVSILQAFEGVSNGEKFYFTIKDFYEKFPNATRAEYRNFMKVGNNVYVAYEECGRSPVKNPLSIFLAR